MNAAAPFDDDDAGFGEELVPADADDLRGAFHAVEVEMEDWQPTIEVFVDEGEGGTGNIGF